MNATESKLRLSGFEHYLSANNADGIYVHTFTNTKRDSKYNGEVIEIDDNGNITDHYSQFKGVELLYGKKS